MPAPVLTNPDFGGQGLERAGLPADSRVSGGPPSHNTRQTPVLTSSRRALPSAAKARQQIEPKVTDLGWRQPERAPESHTQNRVMFR